ncbi:MAG: MlaD family protein [Solirubrobacteraceae bacterium]|nr:MlaD family protein [Solirubrobacteraceae bacterium]
MARAWRENGRWILVIVGFIAAALVVSGYLLSQQRLRLPFTDRYDVRVAFVTAQSLTPNTGQPVSVSGVRVGEVSGVELERGRAIVTLSLDPDRLPRVHRDARALLTPITPLKNMEVELDPGTRSEPALGPDEILDASRTRTTIDVDEILAVLDADSRLYLQQLLLTAGRGTEGRGEDLGDALRGLGPTTAQLRRITAALADRDRLVRRLVRDTHLVAGQTARDAPAINEILAGLDTTLSAVGRQDAAVRASLDRLPGTLRDVGATVRRTAGLSRTAARTARTLRPALRTLPATARDAARLLDRVEPLLRRDVRPLVRDATPLARQALPVLTAMQGITPPARRILSVLTYAFNELVADPGDDRKGYLFWGSWFFHNANSMLSTTDPMGAGWRLLPLVDCGPFASDPALAAVLQPLLGPLVGGCEP